jgi:hypothetical protein
MPDAMRRALEIRPLRPGDEAAAADLAGQLGYPTTAAQARECLLRAAGRPDACILIAARPEDGRVVGWAHAFGVYLVESEPYAELGGPAPSGPPRRWRRRLEMLFGAA